VAERSRRRLKAAPHAPQHLCMANDYFTLTISKFVVRPQFGSSVRKTALTNSADRSIGIATNQAQHTLGLSHPVPPHRENSIHSFVLLPDLPLEHPTHNRWVECSSHSGPTIFYSFHRVINFRASDSHILWVRTYRSESGGQNSMPLCTPCQRRW
jgi:hypothetical protein